MIGGGFGSGVGVELSASTAGSKREIGVVSTGIENTFEVSGTISNASRSSRSFASAAAMSAPQSRRMLVTSGERAALRSRFAFPVNASPSETNEATPLPTRARPSTMAVEAELPMPKVWR